jgi:ubiquinone/menaquinone biosynthesis C-methylase UbiE
MRLIGRLVWGVDIAVLYDSMETVRQVKGGATILDVPCGGGVAFRALRPNRDVRYVAVDLSERMLARARRRAAERSLVQIEFVRADMTALPFPDGQADLFLSYSGLHMLNDPELAVREIARCLKPGGRVLGTTFLSRGARRARALFAIGARRGHAKPPSRSDVQNWLSAASFVDISIGPQAGFVAFEGRKGG